VSGDLAGVLAGINAAVHELADYGGLIDQLADVLAMPTSAQTEVVTGHRPPSSRPPWDVRAANAAMGLHAWARDAEAELGTWVRGFYGRRPNGSDRGTKDALGYVVIYCEDSRVPEAEVRRIARQLGTHLRAAQSVPAIDLAPAPAATLRQPCPYCRTGALTAAVDGSTEIRCANEDCTDPVSGLRPRWAKKDWPFLLSRLAAG
jgi:hypothetical protein